MGKRLYVGNLSFQSTEATLTAAFEGNGRKVSSVHIVADRDTGQPRGFAFVEMASDSDASEAIKALDGKELDGRSLRVNEAEERRPQGGAGSGGRGGAGGRSDGAGRGRNQAW
jgi:RNA recognition motif-containing protein